MCQAGNPPIKKTIHFMHAVMAACPKCPMRHSHAPFPGDALSHNICLVTAVYARTCFDERAGCVTFQSQLCVHVRAIMSRQGA